MMTDSFDRKAQLYTNWIYIFWVINLCSAYEYQISIRFIHQIRVEQFLVGLIPLYVILERGIRFELFIDSFSISLVLYIFFWWVLF